MTDIQPYWQNYIDGAWCDGGTGRVEVSNPGTGEVLAEHALADAADVDRAVAAARRVQDSGALTDMRPVERGRMVQAMGRYLLEHLEEIATVLTLEQGKPLWEARNEIRGAARYFEYYGNQAETVEGRSIPLGAGYFDFTTHEPYGVSAQIIPWNYPVEMSARSLSAGLATGNSCVVKTPELTPLSNAWLARAAEAAGFPAGAVNILCGWGHEAGAALSAHPDIDQVVFTGSVPDRHRHRHGGGAERGALRAGTGRQVGRHRARRRRSRRLPRRCAPRHLHQCGPGLLGHEPGHRAREPP